LIDEQRLRDRYLDKFKTQSRLPPEDALRSVARATTVVGLMLEGLTEKYGAGKKYAVLAVRMGRIFWGLIEVSVPQTISNLLFRYWLFVLYLIEILLIIGGIVFDSPGARELGWKALLVTLAADGIALFFNSVMSGKKTLWWRILRWLFSIMFLAIIVTAFVHLYQDFEAVSNFVMCQRNRLLEYFWLHY
jgi:hypothetical protein